MYDGDTWLWAYYDMYGTFPSWIDNSEGQWDGRLFDAYVDYYGKLPGQKSYNGWDWNWWDWSDDDDSDWSWDYWNTPWLYGGYSGGGSFGGYGGYSGYGWF